MLRDNRLDFIKNDNQEYISMMNDIRKDFIALDTRLRLLGSLNDINKNGADRCLAIARTNLEQASMYTNKTLCLMGENIE